MPRPRPLCALALCGVVVVAGAAGAAPSSAPSSDAARALSAPAAVPVPTGVPAATDVIVQWREDVVPAVRDAVRQAVGLVRKGDLPLPRT